WAPPRRRRPFPSLPLCLRRKGGDPPRPHKWIPPPLYIRKGPADSPGLVSPLDSDECGCPPSDDVRARPSRAAKRGGPETTTRPSFIFSPPARAIETPPLETPRRECCYLRRKEATCRPVRRLCLAASPGTGSCQNRRIPGWHWPPSPPSSHSRKSERELASPGHAGPRWPACLS